MSRGTWLIISIKISKKVYHSQMHRVRTQNKISTISCTQRGCGQPELHEAPEQPNKVRGLVSKKQNKQNKRKQSTAQRNKIRRDKAVQEQCWRQFYDKEESSVVAKFLSMHKVLGSVPSITEGKRIGEQKISNRWRSTVTTAFGNSLKRRLHCSHLQHDRSRNFACLLKFFLY